MGKNYHRKSRFRLPREGYWGAWIRMLPVIVMTGVVPLIVREYKHETGLAEYPWYDSQTYTYEFFLASKSVVLMLLAFFMAGCVAVRIWKEKRKTAFVKLLIPLLAYGGFAFLSACFSINKAFSFSGGIEQFESVWVLLSYVLAVYYAFLYAQSELELQTLADAICFSSSVIGIIGTLQGIGIDLFSFHWFQKLITTEKFLTLVGGKLGLNFADNTAYATLYNPNYLGVFGSFIVPFLVVLIFHEKNKWRRLWHVANFILTVIALLSSRSRAGLIAAVLALCVAIIITLRRLLKWWFLAIPALNFAVVLVLLVNAYNDNVIFERLKNGFKPDVVKVEEQIAEDGTVVRKTGLTELYTSAEGVVFTYNEVTAQVSLYAENDYYGFYALGEDGEQLPIEKVENENSFFFKHPALGDVRLEASFLEEAPGFVLKAAGDWRFDYNAQKGKYQYITVYGKESDMRMAKSWGFENRQRMFSGRGFIWSRTLPLLKDHIFLGSGPDTFVLEFPQEDYLNMSKNGFVYQFMTKPHSWYLQVGVQTGVLSLICLLVFYVWYAVWSLRLYAFRRLSTQTEALGIAAFIGSIGYMISGISNDSMVVTAPVFWGMVGLGLAANVIAARQRKQGPTEMKPETGRK